MVETIDRHLLSPFYRLEIMLLRIKQNPVENKTEVLAPYYLAYARQMLHLEKEYSLSASEVYQVIDKHRPDKLK